MYTLLPTLALVKVTQELEVVLPDTSIPFQSEEPHLQIRKGTLPKVIRKAQRVWVLKWMEAMALERGHDYLLIII